MKRLLNKTLLTTIFGVTALAMPAYVADNEVLSETNANIVRISKSESADRQLNQAQSDVSAGVVAGEVATKSGINFTIKGLHMADVGAPGVEDLIDRSDFSNLGQTLGTTDSVYLGVFHPMTVNDAFIQNRPGISDYDPMCVLLKGREGADVSVALGLEEIEAPQDIALSVDINGVTEDIYKFSGTLDNMPMRQGFGCNYYGNGSGVTASIRFMTALYIEDYSGPKAKISVRMSDYGATRSKNHNINGMVMGRWGEITPTSPIVAEETLFDAPVESYSASGATDHVKIDETNSSAYIQLVFRADFDLTQMTDELVSQDASEGLYSSAVTEYEVIWQYDDLI